jgi:hypothetical protein
MPDGGPGEGHVDHQQTEEGGTAARGKQCLLLLFNLGNFLKTRGEKRNGYVVIKCTFIKKWTREESRSPRHHQHTSSFFVNKYSKDDVILYS